MGFQLDGRFQRCLAGWCRELLGAKLLKRKRRSIGAAASAPPPHGGGWRPEAGPLPLDLLTYAAEDAAAALGVVGGIGPPAPGAPTCQAYGSSCAPANALCGGNRLAGRQFGPLR
eukprot:jgi/Tetstr1/434286/TSEL_023393.t1